MTLPGDENAVPLSGEPRRYNPITPHVSLAFRDPIQTVRLRDGSAPAIFMSVPKAAVHENYPSARAICDIRRSG
jgi:hypothetical protein